MKRTEINLRYDSLLLTMSIINKAALMMATAITLVTFIACGAPNAPGLDVKITDPSDGNTVPNAITVSGTITGDLGQDQFLWLFVGKQADDLWWPQGGSRMVPIKGKWAKSALIGGGPSLDNGKQFEIAVILVNKDVDIRLNDWVNRGNLGEGFNPFHLSQIGDSKNVLAIISVFKGNGSTTLSPS